MTLPQFNSKYVYTKDGTLDSWQVMELVDGKYCGDCEDYVMSLQAKVEGFEKLELYYCKYNGVGHCIGKLGDKWIDCGLQKLVSNLSDKYTKVRKYWWIEIAVKKMIGKVMKWLR